MCKLLIRCLLISCVISYLVSCGQTGQLYLPNDSKTKMINQTQIQPQVSATGTD
jgi:predicted small lipoprotein YifL